MAKRKKSENLQTVIVKKKLRSTREGAKSLVKEMKHRTYTSRETKGAWRFRQRPPECFKKGSFRTKCFNKLGVERSVCLVYGALKDGAKRRKACR